MFPIPLDPRRRRKDHDRDRDSPKSKYRERDRQQASHKTSSNKTRTRDRTHDQDSSSSGSSTLKAKRTVTMVVPEMERRKHSSSALASKSSGSGLGYPSFSKAHSREAVHSLEKLGPADPITPDPTDLGKNRPHTTPPRHVAQQAQAGAPPPSPPLTAEQPDLKRAISGNSMKKAAAKARGGIHIRRKSADNVPYQKIRGFSASRSSLRQAEEGSRDPSTSSPLGRPASAAHLRNNSANSGSKRIQVDGNPATKKAAKAADTKRDSNNTDSDATSVAPGRKSSRRPPTLISNDGESPPSDDDDPQTPGANEEQHQNPPLCRKTTPVLEVFASDTSDTDFDPNAEPNSTPAAAPPPPPPPPPAVAAGQVPRVDYLLQNGGLQAVVPKDFSAATHPAQVQAYNQYMSPQATSPKNIDVQNTFAPYHSLLDSFSGVLSRGGSIAVATGYRSVARRLLDRLEHVFARNISSEKCDCVMCRSNSPHPNGLEGDIDGGVSWGEVLELASARRELPPWPPFSLEAAGLGISNLEQAAAPMQKLDVDVPEEYRDHYIRQSKKTKTAVQNWLNAQPSSDRQPSAPPPAEVDDETLTFAMLTYLEPVQRRTFTALNRGLSSIPDSRTSTPFLHPDQQQQQLRQSNTDFMSKTGLALQRLYRLSKPPRDPECSMFLLKNPSLHSALATLSAISHGEWEILISGRFDGFLWSGADSHLDAHQPRKVSASTLDTHSPSGRPTGAHRPSTSSRSPSKHGSRNPTGTAGLSNIPGDPVAVDEDTEIAVLAEVEREIFLGMEALEDAFERLHLKAESVRTALRERGAGLALGAQRRAGGGSEGVEVRMGTPATGGELGGVRLGRANESNESIEQDFSALDGRSELAPDDSASNIGFRARHGSPNKEARRRYKKRRARRAPAAVDEESGEEAGNAGR